MFASPGRDGAISFHLTSLAPDEAYLGTLRCPASPRLTPRLSSYTQFCAIPGRSPAERAARDLPATAGEENDSGIRCKRVRLHFAVVRGM